MYDRSDPEELERLEKAVEAIFKLTCELGGTLTGEHGIGLAKAPFFHFEHGPAEIELMRKIKRLFDPNHILNPGKMALDP
jgi:glycolate oxidase